jgi:hypothetical protein
LGQFPRRGAQPVDGALVMIVRQIAIAVALIATVLIAGCQGIPQDDRYQTHDGGRSNSRAEVSAATRLS